MCRAASPPRSITPPPATPPIRSRSAPRSTSRSAGHAMADLLVDRGADRLRIGGVAGGGVIERGGDEALHIDHQVMAEAVEFFSGDAGLDEGFDVVENLGGQSSGDAHFFDFFRRLDRD